MPYVVYYHRTADGAEPIRWKLHNIAAREPTAINAVLIGLRTLEAYGASTQHRERFKRLRYVEADVELWEMRAQGRPAYRILFAPVRGVDAYVILHIVRKEDMTKNSQKYIREALSCYEHWTNEVWPTLD